MKRFKSIVLAALAVVVGAAYLLPATNVSAETSSSSLSIVPKKNYVIEPGKDVDDKLTIRNLDTTSELMLTLRVIDFSYSNETGTPKLFLDKDAPQTTWSLKPYLSIPDSVTIPAGKTKTVKMNVSIPKNRGAGTLYSAIVYSTGSGDSSSSNNVGLSASGVTLVFANIPGKVKEDVQITKFGPYDGDSSKYLSFWSASEPQRMGFTIQNNGNVTEAPIGSITLKSMWGKETKIEAINPNNSLALIGQERTFSACIASEKAAEKAGASEILKATNTCVSPGLWPGIYTASIDLFYGQNGNPTQEVTKTAVFLYMPWWFVALVVAVLGALIFGGWKLYNKIRSALYGPKRSKSASSRRK